MPIFFQQEIDNDTRLAIWKIEEDESFFNVPLQRAITHPHKRLQHLAGRYLLQYLFPDFPLALIKVADTRKPYLEDEAFHFSISHCSDYAACLVSRRKRVGVDIEVPSPKVEKIKHKFVHAEERKMVDDGSFKLQAVNCKENILYKQDNPQPLTPNPQLTLLWSAKEAVFKWWSWGNVDFSEMIRLDSFSGGTTGKMEARFLSPGKVHYLQLHYRLFENLCLVWVME